MEWNQIEDKLRDLLDRGLHSELRGALMVQNPVDIASFLEGLDREKMLLLFRVLPKDISADVFSYMSADARQTLIESIGDNEIRSLISDMFLDDTVDFLEELPANVVKRVLQNTDAQTRNLLNPFLQYRADFISTHTICPYHIAFGAFQADLMKKSCTGLYHNISAFPCISTFGVHKHPMLYSFAVRPCVLMKRVCIVRTKVDYNIICLPVLEIIFP